MRRVQQATNTQLFREMKPLYAARKFLNKPSAELKILSFGCSSGDELIGLRFLFPEAQIYGCDINPVVLAEAQLLEGIAEVFDSTEEAILQRGPFDLIVAFSCLCVFPAKADNPMTEAFPFQLFEDLTSLLHAALRDGGVLALVNTGYHFRHTSIYSQFTPLKVPQIWNNGYVHKYSPDGEMVVQSYQSAVYLLLDGSDLLDADLRDCLFVRGSGEQAVDVDIGPDNLLDETGKVFTWSRSVLPWLPEKLKKSAIDVTLFYRGTLDVSGRISLVARADKRRVGADGYLSSEWVGIHSEFPHDQGRFDIQEFQTI